MKQIILFVMALIPALSSAQGLNPEKRPSKDLTYLVLMPCSQLNSAYPGETLKIGQVPFYADANNVLIATLPASEKEISLHIDEIWLAAVSRCKSDPAAPFFVTLMDSAKPFTVSHGP